MAEMKKRDSNMELLRIIAIGLIVFIHAFGLVQYMPLNRFGAWITTVMNSVCNIGVSCFVLISGYFGIKMRWKKMLKLEIMVIFYSLLLVLISLWLFPDTVQGAALLEALAKAVLPVITRSHWFYSCYVCLVFLSPFLNSFIEKTERAVYEKLLLTLLFFFSLCPTLFYFEIMQDSGKGLVNMILLYLLGRWIRLYGNVVLKRWKCILAFFLLWAVNYWSSLYIPNIGPIHHSFTKDNSLTNIAMAVLLIYLFKELKFRSQWVNLAASHVFSVFILNDMLLRLLHTYVIKMDDGKTAGGLFFPLLSLEVLLAFGISVAIGALYRMLFDGMAERICNGAERIGVMIRNKKLGSRAAGWCQKLLR